MSKNPIKLFVNYYLLLFIISQNKTSPIIGPLMPFNQSLKSSLPISKTISTLPRPAEKICDDIAALCNELCREADSPVGGVGVGCPGTIDHNMVLYSNNLDWHDFAMGRYLQARVRLPVSIANDANVAALGEALAGWVGAD